jgi:glycosyltransferase involved in cell wall biosynthesis
VIAYGVGGACETVRDGTTGVLFAEQTSNGLADAIERFEGLELSASDARKNARRFGRERFREEIAQVIAGAAQERR